jgi:hypothetical protein
MIIRISGVSSMMRIFPVCAPRATVGGPDESAAVDARSVVPALLLMVEVKFQRLVPLQGRDAPRVSSAKSVVVLSAPRDTQTKNPP